MKVTADSDHHIIEIDKQRQRNLKTKLFRYYFRARTHHVKMHEHRFQYIAMTAQGHT